MVGGISESIFSLYKRNQETKDVKFNTNFFGTKTRNQFERPLTDVFREQGNNLGHLITNQIMSSGRSTSVFLDGTLPHPLSEDYYEWVDLLEAINEAGSHFSMIELGAGYGRWLVNAAQATRRHQHKQIETLWLCGVEPNPVRAEWMQQHFLDNGLNPGDHALLNCGVSADGQPALMPAEEDPSGGYGNSVAGVGAPLPEGVHEVEARGADGIVRRFDVIPTRTLADLIGTRRIDFLDVDVQGLEVAVLQPCAALLASQVRRIHIGTHAPQIERELCGLLSNAGFMLTRFLMCQSVNQTRYGDMSCLDGIQSWINPALMERRGLG